jgi:hypothetical protein
MHQGALKKKKKKFLRVIGALDAAGVSNVLP